MNREINKPIIIEDSSAAQRVDNYLFKTVKGAPKSFLYRLLRTGKIRVNGKKVKENYRLEIGDEITLPEIRVAEAKEFKPQGKLLSLLKDCVLYEDDELMIINKPTDLAVHSGSGITAGIIEIMRALYPNQKFLELVHRLDRDTSGCLLLAKKRRTLLELHQLFQSGGIRKSYLALLRGRWQGGKKIVNVALSKVLHSGEHLIEAREQGKESITEFMPKQVYQEASLMNVVLHTGRTHQIRVHAAYIGKPVAGDEKYGDKAFNKLMLKYGLRRLFLHAFELKFSLASGKKISVKAPLDKDLSSVLERLKY